MKTLKFLASAAALLMLSGAMTSCKEENDEPTLDTHISVTADKTAVVAGSGEEVTFTLTLSQAAATAVECELTLVGAGAETFVINNPAIVAAGTTGTTVTAIASEPIPATENSDVVVSLVGLPEGYDMTGSCTITVMPAVQNVEGADPAVLAAIKEAHGYDLTPWMGTHNIKGTIEFPGGGTREAFVSDAVIDINSTGSITLDGDAQTPSICLASNPMGMSAYFLETLRKLTVDDNEYFLDSENTSAATVMALINWDANSGETFDVTLPAVKIVNYDPETETADLEFVAEGTDYILGSTGEPIYIDMLEDNLQYSYHASWIPFQFKYSAWDRFLSLYEANDPYAAELIYDSTSVPCPKAYLGLSDILEDYWEVDEAEDGVANLYVAPAGKIDFKNGTMTFEFPFDHADQYGYSRVKVTYSL